MCYAGANVVGSDIDGGNLLSASEEPVVGDKKPAHSKNANFRRRDGRSQRSLSVMDNFKHYHLEERVLDLVGLPVDAWLLPNIQGNAIVDKYDKV
jgi:hypothetical protein